jgi:hypothetical protein
VMVVYGSSTQSRRVLVVETTGTISDMHCSLLYSYVWGERERRGRVYSQQLMKLCVCLIIPFYVQQSLVYVCFVFWFFLGGGGYFLLLGEVRTGWLFIMNLHDGLAPVGRTVSPWITGTKG